MSRDFPITGDERRFIALWKEHGGSQHGPRIEHVLMPYEQFFVFCGALEKTAEITRLTEELAAIHAAHGAEVCRDLRMELSDAQATIAKMREEIEWQPIETIPRDEENVLVTDDRLDGGFPQVVYFEPTDGLLHVNDVGICYTVKNFTHWKRAALAAPAEKEE